MGYFSLPFILLEDISNMNEYKIITLRERPELVAIAAEWFHSKWGVPEEAYLECMEAYLSGKPEYGWYLCLYDESITCRYGTD